MPSFNTVIVSTQVDVETRLEDFGVTRQQIMAIGHTARAYADDASPSMPLNAAGMLSYIHGVGELRQQLVGSDYIPDRACGVESVVRRDRSVRNGAAALSTRTLFEHFGVEPGPLTGVHDGVRTYYVMVGQDGSVELSCPVIEKGKYVEWAERIYIFSPDGDWEAQPETDTGPIKDFEINVSFKD